MIASTLTLRSAQPSDSPIIFDLIRSLADYEQLQHQVTGSAAALAEHLFGDSPYIEAIVADYQGQTVGFALVFTSYSTFLTQPCFYLEDLFVLPDYRGKGFGKALLSHLAQLALDRQYGAMTWSVLDWNQPAIGFYQQIGAVISQTARICRLPATAFSTAVQHTANPATNQIRPAVAADVPALYALAQALAECDHSLSAFVGSPSALAAHLLEEPSAADSSSDASSPIVCPYLEAIVAEQNGEVIGLATFYYNYSTFLTQPGLYIEDLFVQPEHRGNGIGKALLGYLAQQAIDRTCGRLEWLVRSWNQPAIQLYERIGATVLPDWRICRLDRAAMQNLVMTSKD